VNGAAGGLVASLAGGEVATLFLVLMRTTGFVVAAPLLGHRAVPGRVKAGLAAVLAVGVARSATVAPSPVPFWLAAPFELVVGLALGFIVGLGFHAVESVGRLVALQLGLSLAPVFDPVRGDTGSAVDPLFAILAGLLFYALDLHLAMIAALGDSFTRLPLGGGWPGGLGQYAAGLAAVALELGGRLALPLALVLLLAEVAVALVARAIPQVNVFFLGLPVKLLAGLAILVAALPQLAAGAAAVGRFFVSAAGAVPGGVR
jgi:flagellar biosynthetic protein FliR